MFAVNQNKPVVFLKNKRDDAQNGKVGQEGEHLTLGNLMGVIFGIGLNFFQGILPDQFIFKEGNAQDLAYKIQSVLAMPLEGKKSIIEKMNKYVTDNHSIQATIELILQTLKTL